MKLRKKERERSHFTHQDFASVLSKYKYQLNVGDITAGTIFSEEKKGFLVDIGESIVAYLPNNEIRISRHEKTKPFSNNSREFFIVAHNKKVKQLILSIKRLEYIRGWERIKQIKQEDATISLSIHKINKGGLITAIEGIQGFIPNSHMVDINKKKVIVSKKIKCQILFINEKTNTVVLSQKRAILKNLMSKIHVGQNVIGVIIKIHKYGVFINVYGFPALLHASEINNKISDVKNFYTGNHMLVQIIHIDTKHGRLSVSTKRLG